MRILYLHQYFATLESNGGTRSYEFAKRFVEFGDSVTIVTSNAMMPEAFKLLKKPQRIIFEGIELIIIPVKYDNYMSFPQRIFAFLKFAILATFFVIREDADVIFATSTPLTIAIPAIIGKFRHNIPMIFEVRDLWPELPIAVGALKNPLLKSLARGLEWISYHSASHIVALSPGMAEGIAKRNIKLQNISVIPNSCDIGLFNIKSDLGDTVRKRLRLESEQPLIVYAGAFGHINGVDYLIHVAKHMYQIDSKVNFLLLGDGIRKKEVYSLSENLLLLNNTVHIWPPVTKNEIPIILASATIATSLFLPVREMWNNSANKLFDAFAAGKPVAINYGGWQADLLTETGAGITLSATHYHEAAIKLATFINDKNLLQKAQTSARNLAHTRFNRDNLAVKLHTIIHNVVQEGSTHEFEAID